MCVSLSLYCTIMHNFCAYLFIAIFHTFIGKNVHPTPALGRAVQGVHHVEVILIKSADYALAFAFSATFRSESTLVTDAPEA